MNFRMCEQAKPLKNINLHMGRCSQRSLEQRIPATRVECGKCVVSTRRFGAVAFYKQGMKLNRRFVWSIG
jgi:hypothetical protein